MFPIVLSDHGVRMLRAGNLTSIARIVKPQPRQCADGTWAWFGGRRLLRTDVRADYSMGSWSIVAAAMREVCAYGDVGDRLWLREAHACTEDGFVLYRADYLGDSDGIAWRSATKMGMDLSRIRLEITRVAVELLWDATDRQILAEGVERMDGPGGVRFGIPGEICERTAGDAYRAIWGERYASVNPAVWRVDFRVASETAPACAIEPLLEVA